MNDDLHPNGDQRLPHYPPDMPIYLCTLGTSPIRTTLRELAVVLRPILAELDAKDATT